MTILSLQAPLQLAELVTPLSLLYLNLSSKEYKNDNGPLSWITISAVFSPPEHSSLSPSTSTRKKKIHPCWHTVSVGWKHALRIFIPSTFQTKQEIQRMSSEWVCWLGTYAQCVFPLTSFGMLTAMISIIFPSNSCLIVDSSTLRTLLQFSKLTSTPTAQHKYAKRTNSPEHTPIYQLQYIHVILLHHLSSACLIFSVPLCACILYIYWLYSIFCSLTNVAPIYCKYLLSICA